MKARAFLLRECETFQSVEIQIGTNRQVIFCGEAYSVIREIERRYFLAHQDRPQRTKGTIMTDHAQIIEDEAGEAFGIYHDQAQEGYRHLKRKQKTPNREHLRINPDIRFWKKVDRRGDDECWEWTAGRMTEGYGSFKVKTGMVVGAHRYSWQYHNGPIPDGLFVCHHCDNRLCVNPGHLFLGFQSSPYPKAGCDPTEDHS